MFTQIFALSSLVVMPFWFLMIALPHWRWTQRIIGLVWIVVPAAVLYAALVIPQLPTALPLLMNPTLEGIAGLLGSPAGATVGWIHFLAFDLFVGRWAYLDSRAQGMTAWLVSPILFLVLMLGPLGFLLYLAARALLTQSSSDATTARPVRA